jgi:hypothetical protein
MFSPRESTFVEHSTHPKSPCEFFLLGTTLSFLNKSQLCRDQWVFLLLCSIIDYIRFGLNLLNILTFFSK